MVKATMDVFKHLGKLNRGWESVLCNFVKTSSYKKFVEGQDIALSISQGIVDKKIMELKKMADEGEAFSEDQG